MKQSLNLKLSQQLSLTPQLKQSLRLLQLSSQDLEQEIQHELENNPLLEREEAPESDSLSPAEIEAREEHRIPQPVAEATDPSFELERTDTLVAEQDLTENLQETFESRRTGTGRQSAEADAAEYAQTLSDHETLFEHLYWQIQMTSLSERDKLIAKTVLRSIDEDGYLKSTIDEICSMFEPQLEIEADEIHAVLSLIKTLDPIGVGASNLSERLTILLNQLPEDTAGLPIARRLVSEHIDLLGARNLVQLKRALNVSENQLTTSLALITRLNPWITNRFKSDEQNFVIPDVIVKKVRGTWQAAINPDNQSRLRVNDSYASLLQANIDEAGSDYIQKHLQQAKIFIKGLMSRYDTLQLVAQAIVERQQGFFESGEERMQPMILQDIAEQLDLHESTISRATAGKYLLSPCGVFELKYFFSSALSNTEGTNSSSTAIRSLIRKMVDAESKAKPLSDSKIARELELKGHIVARRTVAKYRESMQIAPSSQRKSLI